MNDEELLSGVKKHLGITIEDEDIDRNILMKAKAVQGHLIKGGAKHLVAEATDLDLTCIAIGVNDLLNNQAGETKFSPAFTMLAMQICRG